MSNFNEADADEARRIINALLEDEREVQMANDSLPIADIEQDARAFSDELGFLSYIGEDAPAVLVEEEELVPIALSAVLGQVPFSFGDHGDWRILRDYWDYGPFPGRHFFRNLLRERLNRNPTGIPFRLIPHEQARSTFARRAISFLANRIAWLNGDRDSFDRASTLNVMQRAGGKTVQTPGCHFSVSTNSPGLRVFWSGAYRVSPNYFSHPTTPALSVLQSGTYVFGVDGGAYGNSISWDLNAVVSLPGNPSVHLNY